MLLLVGTQAIAQSSSAAEEAAFNELKTNFAKYGLTQTDVSELRVNDSYTSNGVQHVFVQQFYKGVPMFNGIAGMHFNRSGELAFTTSNFSTGFAEQTPASAPAIDAKEAALAAATTLGLEVTTTPTQLAREGNKIVYSWTEVSNEPVTAQLMYTKLNDELLLSWQIYIGQKNTADMWLLQVDALKGNTIQRFNQTLYCSFDGSDLHGKNGKMHRHERQCFAHVPAINTNLPVHEAMLEAAVTDGSSYNVFPFGLEAPLFGDREIITEPADPVASPFGWHDVDGVDGPEFTITRGNNVRAYPDRLDTNSPDPDPVVDGGEELEFDFFYEDFGSLDDILPAAVTQLFYYNNMLHDWAYHHGFDEASGNFQQNNYGNGGLGNDAVQAEAQDGSGVNNANFGTPADGGSGRMQMYVWNNSGSSEISIDEPVEISGTVIAGPPGWGPDIEEAVTGNVVVAMDGTAQPELLCEAAVNAAELSGNVALIRRGDCFFETKVANAQAAGAIAAIICNPENTIINMGATGDVVDPTIPSVLIEEFRCAEIRAQIEAGNDVVITFPPSIAPPPIDGDFDNGIIAHELGHGFSNRLVGGPGNASCLFNTEQMGEGWSDFFGLAASPINGATTMPDGSEPRGIGNFATNRGPQGGGIRRQRYSTDMAVNDFTYDDVITSGIPHPLGEIWATTLWDLYWAMVEDHGFDPDLINGSGGNNIAVELVLEGMKNTKCLPGMVDGRDGILTADVLINNGENVCRIWEVFARRGLGFSADQGSSESQFDGVEAFDLPPSCIPTVKLTKTTDKVLIDQGDEFEITLSIRNDKAEAVTNVQITDFLPNGLNIIESSIEGADAFELDGSNAIFTINTLETGNDGVVQITYDVTTNDSHSFTQFFDGVENGFGNWTFSALNGEGNDSWVINNNESFEGNSSWFVPNTGENNDQVLFLFEPFPLSGDAPGLRFYTQYNTESKWDAGLIEYSLDFGDTWQNVGNDRIIRGQYRGEVEPSAFDASVNDLNSYWGQTADWREVVVDLSEFNGQNFMFRFRFGSDGDATSPVNAPAPGWYVDNIEYLDVFRYNGVATLTTDQGDTAEAYGQDGGVLVESTTISDANDPLLEQTSVSVYPNPANNFVNVNVQSKLSGEALVQLTSVDGRLIAQQALSLVEGRNTANFNTSELAAGVYLIQVASADRIFTEKITVQ